VSAAYAAAELLYTATSSTVEEETCADVVAEPVDATIESLSVPAPALIESPELIVVVGTLFIVPESTALNVSLVEAPVNVSRPVVSELTLYPDNPLI
jgi:hypothetical protein